MGMKNSVFIREGTFTMDTITKLIMILHNMFRNSIVANKNVVRVPIHLANATHYHIVRVLEGPLLGGRGLEWRSCGHR